MTNEPYALEITSPLIRPGLKLTVGPFSKKYAVQAVKDAMEVVRKINEEPCQSGNGPVC